MSILAVRCGGQPHRPTYQGPLLIPERTGEPTCAGLRGAPAPLKFLRPRAVSLDSRMFEAWEIELHGHTVVYRTMGSGPPVVLIHGMVNSSRHWRGVAERLAERH